MGWTDERVETLKTLWLDGLSASQIAKQLGGVTRNAVIGKVHRLGLSGRATPSQPTPVAFKPPRPARPVGVAPPIARVMARRIEPGLAVGVAVLRRLTPTPIFVPRAPAIDSSIQLFPQGQGGTAAGYTYFLCRTVQCASRDTVAEVAVSPEATANTRATPNVDLACGVRGSFIGISETAFSAQLSWHDRGLAFTILSARKNPSNTDIVALARSIVANASTCRTRLIRR